MIALKEKLKKLKFDLKSWNKEVFGFIGKKKKKKKTFLQKRKKRRFDMKHKKKKKTEPPPRTWCSRYHG